MEVRGSRSRLDRYRKRRVRDIIGTRDPVGQLQTTLCIKVSAQPLRGSVQRAHLLLAALCRGIRSYAAATFSASRSTSTAPSALRRRLCRGTTRPPAEAGRTAHTPGGGTRTEGEGDAAPLHRRGSAHKRGAGAPTSTYPPRPLFGTEDSADACWGGDPRFTRPGEETAGARLLTTRPWLRMSGACAWGRNARRVLRVIPSRSPLRATPRPRTIYRTTGKCNLRFARIPFPES